jgi:hypothetical protein
MGTNKIATKEHEADAEVCKERGKLATDGTDFTEGTVEYQD